MSVQCKEYWIAGKELNVFEWHWYEEKSYNFFIIRNADFLTLTVTP